MNIFCISIFNQNYANFKKLGLIPVGLGNNKFNDKWINDRKGKNITSKNLNFGEYTFHYNLWKNKEFISSYKGWVGFCTYRRYWTKISNKKILKSINYKINTKLKEGLLKTYNWYLNLII